MKETYKILVAAPTYVGKEYAMERWIENVNSFTHPHSVLLVDNSSSDAFSSRYEKRLRIIHIKSDKHLAMKRVTQSMEVIRQRFLLEKFDFWFNLEIDVIPKVPDVIEQMLEFAVKFDLVNHAYPSRNGDDIQHQGIGCSFINRQLALNINYDEAGDVTPDCWLWGKVRKKTHFKMLDIWNLFPVLHLAE